VQEGANGGCPLSRQSLWNDQLIIGWYLLGNDWGWWGLAVWYRGSTTTGTLTLLALKATGKLWMETWLLIWTCAIVCWAGPLGLVTFMIWSICWTTGEQLVLVRQCLRGIKQRRWPPWGTSWRYMLNKKKVVFHVHMVYLHISLSRILCYKNLNCS